MHYLTRNRATEATLTCFKVSGVLQAKVHCSLLVRATEIESSMTRLFFGLIKISKRTAFVGGTSSHAKETVHSSKHPCTTLAHCSRL
eukprot:scaffold1053_cov332-Pavlova_lutheri.AAC.12